MEKQKIFWLALATAAIVYSLVAVFYPLVGDEQFHAYFARFTAEKLMLPINYPVNPQLWYFYPPGYVIVAGAFIKAFGWLLGSLYAARVYSVLAMLATMALAYKLVEKRLPQADKLILLAFFIASPFLASNAGLATITPLGLLAGTATIYLVYELLDKPGAKLAVLAGIGLGACLLTHLYMLPMLLIVPAIALLERSWSWKKIPVKALAIVFAVAALMALPFYGYQLLNYGSLNGPAKAVQGFGGGAVISPFDAGCVYIDPWLSGLNAFVHFDDSFSRIGDWLHLPAGLLKLGWGLHVAFLYAVIAAGALWVLKKRPAFLAIALLSLPPVLYGNCFIRYAGVLPVFLGIFLAAGITAVKEWSKSEKARKVAKIIVLLLLAAFLAQTFLTMQQVRASKVPVYNFIKSIPSQVSEPESRLCMFSRPGETIAALPTLLLDREIRPCLQYGYTDYVLAVLDSRGLSTYEPEDVAKLQAEYEIAGTANGGTDEVRLYKKK